MCKIISNLYILFVSRGKLLKTLNNDIQNHKIYLKKKTIKMLLLKFRLNFCLQSFIPHKKISANVNSRMSLYKLSAIFNNCSIK